MPGNRPTVSELVESVREMMEDLLLLKLVDKSRVYHTRVAVNVLKIVERELGQSTSFYELERESLQNLLGIQGELPDLNDELVARINRGAFDRDNGELMAHFLRTVTAKVAIDNPEYATYKNYLASGELSGS